MIANTFALDNTQNGITLAPQSANSIVVATINQTTASGNGTGMALGSNIGFVDATINNSHADINNTLGINTTLPTFITMKNSTVDTNKNGSNDFANAGSLHIYNNNTVGGLSNGGSSFTDGTNNIGTLFGNALTLQAPQ